MSASAAPLLIVVSGMSGSGKSVALRTLEDLGFYCVDNLPADLLPAFVRSVADADESPGKLAVGIKVASAVETAHRAQIVHRDIKPANILVS